MTRQIRGPNGGFKIVGGIAGGMFLGGTLAMASEAEELAATFSDFSRHLAEGDTAMADLDAATFAAQLQGGGSDYFFTMAVLDVMITLGEK